MINSWIDVFGERLYMQCPEEVDRNAGMEVDFDKCFGWLMQFKDGNRIDLRVMPIDVAQSKLRKINYVSFY